jgi:hypothetical protein
VIGADFFAPFAGHAGQVRAEGERQVAAFRAVPEQGDVGIHFGVELEGSRGKRIGIFQGHGN